MNLQQLRYVRAAVKNDLNLTKVANELFTSQSGVSKQIRELEQELRVDIFVRRGKRLVGLTPAGENAAKVIDRLLQEADNLKRLSDQFAQADKGRLIIAATHNQANYVLPRLLLQFGQLFPKVEVELLQGSPSYVVDALVRGEADIGVATEAVDGNQHLETYPCFTWRHVAIAPEGHPLLDIAEPTLADIARYPIITYNAEFSGGSRVIETFERAGIEVDLRLRAMDADVIKTYVRLGAGVGIIAEMAIDGGAQGELRVVPGSGALFGAGTTKIALQKGTLLRNYAYQFVAMLAPHLDPDVLSGKKRARPAEQAVQIAPFTDRKDLLLVPTPGIEAGALAIAQLATAPLSH
ncbi:LysR substrate-binding domain-containing protein [Novosphingobium cyanobacteriorum]|uniref:LysR substrate-binding domain-containing protein n=1 Tax=Novosphingobium cyanobacteriorum TaxID=3024215 RepID=A0ABT6CLK8_9SPHN|nr:LysR substrate-binding domain-containing protein [Novosphingobium cyanobacteriorum]MDF8334681.1 LysR substrate-binding domain-containing protein [Novosphingobium cyanobacteriorum]